MESWAGAGVRTGAGAGAGTVYSSGKTTTHIVSVLFNSSIVCVCIKIGEKDSNADRPTGWNFLSLKSQNRKQALGQ